MRQYFTKCAGVLVQIDAENIEEAKSKTLDDYANSGFVPIITREYKLVSTRTTHINTDYPEAR